MTKKINNLHKPMTAQRILLIICGVIIAAFILFVLIAAGSLIIYIVPHMLVLLGIWDVLKKSEVEDSTMTRLTLFFAVFGVVSAIFLLYFYVPLLYSIYQ
jgi:hypothetical protein